MNFTALSMVRWPHYFTNVLVGVTLGVTVIWYISCLYFVSFTVMFIIFYTNAI